MNQLGSESHHLQLRLCGERLYFDSTRLTGNGILVRVHDGRGCARPRPDDAGGRPLAEHRRAAARRLPLRRLYPVPHRARDPVPHRARGETAVSAHVRARTEPRLKCPPEPSARRRWGHRAGSKRSGSAKPRSSRQADGIHSMLRSPASLGRPATARPLGWTAARRAWSGYGRSPGCGCSTVRQAQVPRPVGRERVRVTCCCSGRRAEECRRGVRGRPGRGAVAARGGLSPMLRPETPPQPCGVRGVRPPVRAATTGRSGGGR